MKGTSLFPRAIGQLALLLVVLCACPAVAQAAVHEPLQLPVWTVAPFVILLSCIAVLPLVAGHFWHNDVNKIIVVAVLALPVVVFLVYWDLTTPDHALAPLVHEISKYASFIILLGSLYTVAGGVVVRGQTQPTPLKNMLLLGGGALLANLIGTAGASVLLIRPFLRMNAARKNTAHLPMFFIFSVSNLGGCLTPLGDPPLYMGYLNGVPFTWNLQMWPEFLVVNSLVLIIFFVWDTLTMRSEVLAPRPAEPFRLEGKINLLLLVGIMGAVLFEADYLAPVWRQIWRLGGTEVVMLAIAGLSLWLTPRALRKANEFTWAPMTEVAILFAGIFITMIPALQLLEANGQHLGITRPGQFFWYTGLLSAALDNAPTYLAFATLAAGSNNFALLVENRVPGLDGPLVLRAISCGAVFMGALSYIGNGPNFMVKAIAEKAGYKPPSFFGYSLRAVLILGPIFGLVHLLFYALLG